VEEDLKSGMHIMQDRISERMKDGRGTIESSHGYRICFLESSVKNDLFTPAG
jgi:hypothetical protein